MTRQRSRGASAGQATAPRYVDVPLIDVDDTMVQGELFPDEGSDVTIRGYRGTVASEVAGITYRQLDYWARKRIVVPSITPSNGSGTRRLYSFDDVVILAVSKKLLDIGVNLQNATSAIEFLIAQPPERLRHLTILCDGQHVEECSDGGQIAQALEDGDAVFCVSVEVLWTRVEAAVEHADYTDVTGAVRRRNTRPIDDIAAQSMRERLERRRIEHARFVERYANQTLEDALRRQGAVQDGDDGQDTNENEGGAA